MNTLNSVSPEKPNFQYPTILDGFDDSVAQFPKNPCITFMGKTTDYAHIQMYAKRFAVYLRRLGVQPGERVMIHLPDCPQWTIAYLGCFYAGVVATPYSPASTKFELAGKIQEYGVVAIVTMDLFYPIVKEALGEIPANNLSLREYPIVASVPEFLPIVASFFAPSAPELLHTAASSLFCVGSTWKYKHVLKEAKHQKELCTIGDTRCAEEAEKKIGKSKDKVALFSEARKALVEDSRITRSFGRIIREHIPQHEIDTLAECRPSPSDLAHILSTGGTTGGQKGVMFSHGKVADNANRCLNLFGFSREGETFFVVLPLDHAFALTAAHNTVILSANRMLMEIDGSDLFALKKTIIKEKPTILVLVPAQGAGLVGIHKGEDLRSVKYTIFGGSALPAIIEENFNRMIGKEVARQGGGATETGPVMACNSPTRNRKGSIGIPLDGIEIKIMGEKENGAFEELPAGEIGQIWVNSPSNMDGYWNNPEATARVMTKDGYLKLADFGSKDKDGFVYFKDRTDDTIVDNKGRKKYPNDIENILMTHEAVADAAVAGVNGEVFAFVVLQADYPENDDMAAKLTKYVTEHMERYNAPKVIRFEKELPKSRMKKNLRRVLRERELKKLTGKV
jgi:acyl-CoA synthetase (AMP-forming)/AMP-acid ligase II